MGFVIGLNYTLVVLNLISWYHVLLDHFTERRDAGLPKMRALRLSPGIANSPRKWLSTAYCAQGEPGCSCAWQGAFEFKVVHTNDDALHRFIDA